MTFLQAVFHMINFVLPAVAMAAWVPLAGRWVMGAGGGAWSRRAAWHLLAGVLVLASGLLLQGQDGLMSTYAALVLVAASLEWLLHRRWRWA